MALMAMFEPVHLPYLSWKCLFNILEMYCFGPEKFNLTFEHVCTLKIMSKFLAAGFCKIIKIPILVNFLSFSDLIDINMVGR